MPSHKEAPPKRPTTAFAQFVKLNCLKSGQMNRHTLARLSEEWKNVDNSKVRRECVKKAERELKLYRAKKSEYESRRPKRALNAYQLFMRHSLNQERKQNGIANLKEAFSHAAKKWKSMEESEKEKWRNLNASNKSSNNNKPKNRSARNRSVRNRSVTNRSVRRGSTKNRLTENRSGKSRSRSRYSKRNGRK